MSGTSVVTTAGGVPRREFVRPASAPGAPELTVCLRSGPRVVRASSERSSLGCVVGSRRAHRCGLRPWWVCRGRKGSGPVRPQGVPSAQPVKAVRGRHRFGTRPVPPRPEPTLAADRLHGALSSTNVTRDSTKPRLSSGRARHTPDVWTVPVGVEEAVSGWVREWVHRGPQCARRSLCPRMVRGGRGVTTEIRVPSSPRVDVGPVLRSTSGRRTRGRE